MDGIAYSSPGVDSFSMDTERYGGETMLRIGGTASLAHMTVFKGLKTHFQQRGIDLDWVLYSN